MKIFVSYAFTGEDRQILARRLERLRDTFSRHGVDFYMNMFAEEYDEMEARQATPAEYLQLAFRDLGDSDVVFIIMSSPRRSEGVLMEVGASAWLGKKIVLLQHHDAVGSSYLPTLADETIVWDTEDGLIESVEDFLKKVEIP